MAKCVDGLVLPLLRSKFDEYKKTARFGLKLLLGHGTLDYQELIA